MTTTHLTGLRGTNPLGFLAALGTQVAFASEREQPRLWWTDDVVPHAVVDFDMERIVEQAMEVFARWASSRTLNPPPPLGDDLKLTASEIRTYLECASSDPATHLAAALVAEDSLDNNSRAKPSDLYFTAGQQQFLDVVRTILCGASCEDVTASLSGPWPYGSKLPSLGWDVTDDRQYALRAKDPSSSPEKKRTNPGAEALALLGLTLHPVFRGNNGTLTQGCSGAWKSASYSWPLWSKAASPNAVKSMLAHAYDHPAGNRTRWLLAWGVFRTLKSSIRRSGQGGYGTFGPPTVTWQIDRVRAETPRPPDDRAPSRDLAASIRDRFAPFGDVDLHIPPREPVPPPPTFD